MALKSFLVLLLICSLSYPLYTLSELQTHYQKKVRVLISEGTTSFEISGDNLIVKMDAKEFKKYDGHTSHRFNFNSKKKEWRLDNKRVKGKNIEFSSSSTTIITLNKLSYKGMLTVHLQNKNFSIINYVEIEDYLGSLINSEVNSKWNIELLKAQAVTARTFALFQMIKNKNNPYDMKSTILDQVYDGYARVSVNSTRAALQTKGEILTFNGNVIKAFFHSCCGGQTDTTDFVWSEKAPYIQSVKDPHCISNSLCLWEYKISENDLIKKLSSKMKFQTIRQIKVNNKSPASRIVDLSIEGNPKNLTIRAEDLRQRLGYTNLKCTRFTANRIENDFIFKGHGIGHGVGMCQLGAKAMADKGSNYKSILTFYFPTSRITKIQ